MSESFLMENLSLSRTRADRESELYGGSAEATLSQRFSFTLNSWRVEFYESSKNRESEPTEFTGSQELC